MIVSTRLCALRFLSILFVASVAGSMLSPSLEAQSDPDKPVPPVKHVELTSITATPKGEGWQVEFSGSAPKLPTGTEITFSLWYRTFQLQEFSVELSGTKKFREKRVFEEMTGFARGVFLRAEVDFLSQPRKVREAMEKDPEIFQLDRSPWTVRFQKQKFDLGSTAQIDGQANQARTLFRDALKTALGADKRFSQNRKQMLAGSKFQSGGSFDSAAWQKFAEEEVRDPLRKLQKELRKAEKSLLLLPHKRDFGYLTDIVNAVALRSYERSRSAYEKLGMSPDPADFSPKDIQVSCPSSKSSYLSKRTKQLCKSQKIELSEIGG